MPININDYSVVEREGEWLDIISLPLISTAWFITAFFILVKQFKVFGQHHSYLYVTGEWVNTRKHQGRGLGKYELQRETHRQSSLLLFTPNCIKMRWRVSTSSDGTASESQCPCHSAGRAALKGWLLPTQPLLLQSCLEMVCLVFYEKLSLKMTGVNEG